MAAVPDWRCRDEGTSGGKGAEQGKEETRSGERGEGILEDEHKFVQMIGKGRIQTRGCGGVGGRVRGGQVEEEEIGEEGIGSRRGGGGERGQGTYCFSEAIQIFSQLRILLCVWCWVRGVFCSIKAQCLLPSASTCYYPRLKPLHCFLLSSLPALKRRELHNSKSNIYVCLSVYLST